VSITSYTMTPFGPQTLVTVASSLTSPTIYWYLDGIYVGKTADLSRWFYLSSGEQAEVVAIDSTSSSFDPIDNQPSAWPSRRNLWWTRSDASDVTSYKVYQKLGAGAYAEIAEVRPAEGAWSFQVLTPRLDDLGVYTWEVRPLDAAGNEGTALEIGPETIVRRPDSPDFGITYNYNSGPTTVTFAAA